MSNLVPLGFLLNENFALCVRVHFILVKMPSFQLPSWIIVQTVIQLELDQYFDMILTSGMLLTRQVCYQFNIFYFHGNLYGKLKRHFSLYISCSASSL